MLAKCPHCEESFIIDEKLAEEIIICPSCKQEFVPMSIPQERKINPGPRRVSNAVRSSKLLSCPDCGHQVSPSARSCPGCGRLMAADEKPSAVLLVVLWLAGLLIPFVGMWLVVLLTSILYYAWKRDYPNKAKTINRHGWMIFLVSFIIAAIWLMTR